MTDDWQTFAELHQMALDETCDQLGVTRSKSVEEIAIKMALKTLVTDPLREELRRIYSSRKNDISGT